MGTGGLGGAEATRLAVAGARDVTGAWRSASTGELARSNNDGDAFMASRGAPWPTVGACVRTPAVDGWWPGEPGGVWSSISPRRDGVRLRKPATKFPLEWRICNPYGRESRPPCLDGCAGESAQLLANLDRVHDIIQNQHFHQDYSRHSLPR